MMLSAGLRKLALTAHVTFSVGWLGAVAGFLALAVAAFTSSDARIVRSAYLAMELTATFAIVPLCLASLLSGIVQSLGTSWGLIRNYWVLFKLLINVFATVVLLLHMNALRYFADAASDNSLTDTGMLALRSPSPVIHAGGALFLLAVATTLAVYKPRGVTPYGRRKELEARRRQQR